MPGGLLQATYCAFRFICKHIVVNTHRISQAVCIRKVSNNKSDLQAHSSSLVFVPFDRPYTAYDFLTVYHCNYTCLVVTFLTYYHISPDVERVVWELMINLCAIYEVPNFTH